MSAQPGSTSHLPKHVRAQVERANQIVAEMNKPPAADPPGTPPATPPPAVVPPATPSATPPATPPTPPVTPPATPPAADALEQKYKVLQGKYNAEVPRLQKRVQEQDSELRDLKQQLLNQQTLLAAMNTRTPPPPAAPATPLVSAEEVKEFGPDLIDVIGRVAKQTLLPEIESRVKPVQQRVEQTEKGTKEVKDQAFRDARAKVLDLLQNEVSNYLQVNQDPAFIAWLGEVDPYAGRLREDLLQEAYTANNGPRVVAFFKGYLAEHAATAPPLPPAPPATPPSPPESQRTLDSLVAPGTPKSGPGSAPTDAGKRTWTRAEIGALFEQIATYSRKGRKVPDELRAQERDVMKAQTENRVQN